MSGDPALPPLSDLSDLLDRLLEVLNNFWAQVQDRIDPIELLGIGDILDTLHIHYMYEVLAFLIIFGLTSLFAAQVYAWSTKPNPSNLGAVALGVGTGVLSYVFIVTKVPMIPAVLGACITGVYSWQGYVYVGGLMALTVVFTVNTLDGWRKDTQLEILR